MLTSFDVIAGAAPAGQPGFYVIGSYDSRITFYSQQVRALELVHALHSQGYLRDDEQIAIVGGGAAGITLAAALALTTQSLITLFEKADEPLWLQRESRRRNLDPHLYDWPADDAVHPISDLPILDWRSDSAQVVRNEVLQAFAAVRHAVGTRLQVHTRHAVRAVRRVNTTFEVEFERDATAPEHRNEGPRVVREKRVNRVFLAVGFGLEPENPAPGVMTESYWSDAGVPGQDVAGRATPRFFVSGNGDGGLIDLVAAATVDFNHAGMIRAITGQSGVDEVFPLLSKIDADARLEQAAGRGFDFVAAYEATIYAQLERLGLVDAVRQRLRPGVQIIFQTRHPEIFTAQTATLNRVAAYLVMKACGLDDIATFRHIHCADAAPAPPPAGQEGQAPYWMQCDAEVIGVDKVIIRRGPDRAAVCAPFRNLLGDFALQHNHWLDRHGEGIVTPTLSDGARDRFTRAAQAYSLPLPRHVQEIMAERLPILVQVQSAGQKLRWSGELRPDTIAVAWAADSNSVEIHCRAPPDQLGAIAMAVARVAIHADRTALVADVAAWRPFLERVSTYSPHAGDLLTPNLCRSTDAGTIRSPETYEPGALYGTLQGSLDAWVLSTMHEHLEGFLKAERDPGNRIGFRVAPALRERMLEIWTDWRRQFQADPALLGRFLCLTLCALDDPNSVPEAYTLVGPKKLTAIVRSTAVALAVAVGWQVMVPHGQQPGNLVQRPAVGQHRTGHACAADRIAGDPIAVSASKFIWKTNFVVLPLVNAPIRLTVLSAKSLSKFEGDQPRLNEADDRSNIAITSDGEFLEAVAEGVPAIAALLARVLDAHYRRLSRAIERAEI